MPCKLCGVRSALGQHMHDTAAVDQCTVSLGKGSTTHIKKPIHQCKIVGSVNYNLASAAKSTLTVSRMNRPFQCGHCKLVVASYSMLQHYSDAHSNTPMPDGLAEEVQLAEHERDHTLQMLSRRAPARTSALAWPAAPTPRSRRKMHSAGDA